MKEGYWINYITGEVQLIDDHWNWLRAGGNALRIGVPREVVAEFNRKDLREDRIRFLLYVIRRAPLIRVRGHGASITFEFYAKEPTEALQAILRFLRETVQPQPEMTLRIVDFARRTFVDITYRELRSHVENGDVTFLNSARTLIIDPHHCSALALY